MSGLVALPRSAVRRAGELLAVWQSGKSEATQRAYAADLAALRTWAGLASDAGVVAAWLALPDGQAAWAVAQRWRDSMDAAPRTVARRLSTLRSLTTAARRAGAITWSLEIDGPRLSGTVRDTRGPTPAQVAHVLRHVADVQSGPGWGAATERWGLSERDTVILLLLHDSALRCAEVCALRYPEHVDVHRGQIRISGKGSGGALTWWPLSRRTVAALRAWLDHRGTRPGPLLSWPWQSPLARTTIYRIVRRRAEQCGFVGWHPHGLRHTAATTIQRLSGDLALAQRFLRHASPVTTSQHYIDPDPSDLVRVAELVASATAVVDARHRRARAKPRGAHPSNMRR